jgi:hypothetical protein
MTQSAFQTMHSVPDSAGETNRPLSHKFIQSLLTKDKGKFLALQLCIQEILDSYSDHETEVFRDSPATVPETSSIRKKFRFRKVSVCNIVHRFRLTTVWILTIAFSGFTSVFLRPYRKEREKGPRAKQCSVSAVGQALCNTCCTIKVGTHL